MRGSAHADGGHRRQLGGSSGGRWALLPARAADPTELLHFRAGQLLDRYGIVSRALGTQESLGADYDGIYQVLSAFERLGQVRRGYFIADLGASQFAETDAVDVLRSLTASGSPGFAAAAGPAAASQSGAKRAREALILAACDPANPYGSILPWPSPVTGTSESAEPEDSASGRLALDASTPPRPSRTPGSAVVLVDGELVMYIGRGGRSLLTFSPHDVALATAAHALADEARGSAGDSASSRLRIERVDGHDIHGSSQPAVAALLAAGFRVTPRGLAHPS